MGKHQSKVNHFCQPLCASKKLESVTHIPTVEDDGAQCKIPILCLSGVVLVPGQTLPLHLFESNQATMIQRLADNDQVFGVVTERFLGPTERHARSSIGTTVDIISVEEDSNSAGIKVKGIGCRRFQVISTQRQIDGTVMATIQLLRDKDLSPVLDSIMLSSQRRCLSQDFQDSPVNCSNNSTRKRNVDRFSAAAFTPWPSWVYKQYDAKSVMTDIRKELALCNDTLNEVSRSKEPGDYAFWLMANLPMDDELKLTLLSVNSSIQRLRYELGILKSCTVLCCKDCGLFIADKKDIFSMTRDGPLGMYVNPGGYVHEMITVYKVDGLKTIGGPSTENTWFNGFAWTVVQCRHCTAHIGWKFTALQWGTNPDKFWGVCRTSVLPGVRQDHPQLEPDLCNLTL